MEAIKESYYSVSLENKVPGESPIYRNPRSKEKLAEVPESRDTILKIFEDRCKRNNYRNSFEYSIAHSDREFFRNMGIITRFSYSFEDIRCISLYYSNFLATNNCIDKIHLDNKDWKFVGIYAKNCPEWIMAYIGNMYNDVTTVSIYDTLGPDGIAYILELTQLTTLVIQSCYLDKIFKLHDEGKTAKLKNLIIVVDQQSTASTEDVMNREANVAYKAKFNIYHMSEIIDNSGLDADLSFDLYERNRHKYTPCTTNSTLLISFTSGSTGIPKGALMTHRGLCNQIYSVLETHHLPLEEFKERHFSYLPYAHIFEQVFFGFSLIRGVSTTYYSGDTRKIAEDILRAEPTFFIAVPRILLRFYDSVRAILGEKTGMEKALIDVGFREKKNNMRNDNNYKHFFFDPLVFDKVRKRIFGKNDLKFMLVASAPIDAEVLDYFKIVLSCPIMEAYGMTEEHGAVTYTHIDDCYSGHVGGPITCMEIKLIDVPELNYYTTDVNKDTGKLEPRGEICSRGPCVFTGYLCMPQEYAETVDKDGWLHSGDIGVMVNNEKLKIFDRRKNIFKLSQGEYIAPEKVENVLKLSKYAAQSYVYGQSTQNYVVALIVIDPTVLSKLAAQLNISETQEQLLVNSTVNKTVLDEVTGVCRQQKLHGFEIPQKIILSLDQFTIENGLLTTTMKMKRHEVRKVWEERLRALY